MIENERKKRKIKFVLFLYFHIKKFEEMIFFIHCKLQNDLPTITLGTTQ